MNKLSKKLILPSLATLLLFNGSLFANEPDGKAELQHSLRKVNFNFADYKEQFKLAPRETLNRLQYTLAAFPINCHRLKNIADNQLYIEFEDSSQWEICPSDAYILSSWRHEDALIIAPNYGLFGPYSYYIINKNNKDTYVKANVKYLANPFGPNCHWIVGIDHLGGHVFLENQMNWCVDPRDLHVIKNWAANDHIIFGVNDTWFSPYDHILINVNMDDHVRVKQY